MEHEINFYRMFEGKTRTELIHLALNSKVEKPEKMTRKQLMDAIINSPYPRSIIPAKKYAIFDGDETPQEKNNAFIITKESLQRAEYLMTTCIKDVFKILLGEI